MEEIHRCRVDHVARLLVETNMSIGEIALASGFEIDAHVARYFARQTGMTPLATGSNTAFPEFTIVDFVALKKRVSRRNKTLPREQVRFGLGTNCSDNTTTLVASRGVEALCVPFAKGTEITALTRLA